MAYIGENEKQRLALIKDIDLKTVGQTILYNVPAGKNCIITDVVLHVTGASTVTVAPIIRIGKVSAYNEWLVLTTLTGLDAVDKFVRLASATTLTIHRTFAASDQIKLDVQTGATATTLTVTAHVFGYCY